MRIKDIINFLEQWSPLAYQEHYDNSGLIIGAPDDQATSCLVSLDVTEEVLDEAIHNNCQLIIAHHPLLFSSIKKIGRKHWIDRCIRKAIKHDIAIYAIHTNLDSINTGVNKKIAEKLALSNLEILQPKKDLLSKLTVLVPESDSQKVAEAMFQAGAGNIGNYDQCSFQLEGIGSFRPNEHSRPTIGKKHVTEKVNEIRIEVLVKNYQSKTIINAMKTAHPYEEVAYFLNPLSNINQEVGIGMVGQLKDKMEPDAFLEYIKKSMDLNTIKYTPFDKPIYRVAVCGGSGSFLLKSAMARGADAFISADFKYHDYFESDNHLMIADIGHYESEVYTKELLYDKLQQNFTNFAVRLSKVNTNPIKYF